MTKGESLHQAKGVSASSTSPTCPVPPLRLDGTASGFSSIPLFILFFLVVLRIGFEASSLLGVGVQLLPRGQTASSILLTYLLHRVFIQLRAP